jgi:hypothetical protein
LHQEKSGNPDLDAVDPHDDGGLEDGEPESGDATAVRVHDVEDVLTVVRDQRQALTKSFLKFIISKKFFFGVANLFRINYPMIRNDYE